MLPHDLVSEVTPLVRVSTLGRPHISGRGFLKPVVLNGRSSVVLEIAVSHTRKVRDRFDCAVDGHLELLVATQLVVGILNQKRSGQIVFLNQDTLSQEDVAKTAIKNVK